MKENIYMEKEMDKEKNMIKKVIQNMRENFWMILGKVKMQNILIIKENMKEYL